MYKFKNLEISTEHHKSVGSKMHSGSEVRHKSFAQIFDHESVTRRSQAKNTATERHHEEERIEPSSREQYLQKGNDKPRK